MTGHAAIDPADYRQVLAQLPTGVTVITAHGAGGPLGMAANSVTSVSLNPPLVLFCPSRSSSTCPGIRAAGAFCINVMARHHEAITRGFAARTGDRFANLAREDRHAGPGLVEALAWIECLVEDEHDAGDHTIVVARVTAIEAASALGDPLVFFRGAYGSFAAGAPASGTASRAAACRPARHANVMIGPSVPPPPQ
jgi:flavin reductase (DIM6/NTAB) family NADH-FMN oxidoreductase RutF